MMVLLEKQVHLQNKVGAGYVYKKNLLVSHIYIYIICDGGGGTSEREGSVMGLGENVNLEKEREGAYRLRERRLGIERG